MPPLEWTTLATADHLGALEERLRAHTEQQVARSTQVMVAATIGAAMANIAVLVTALGLS